MRLTRRRGARPAPRPLRQPHAPRRSRYRTIAVTIGVPIAAAIAYYAYAAYSSGDWPRTLPLPGGSRRQALGILAMASAVVVTIVVIAGAIREARRPRFHVTGRNGAAGQPPAPPPIVVPRERTNPERPRRQTPEDPPADARGRRAGWPKNERRR
jgi:hypothetical protein